MKQTSLFRPGIRKKLTTLFVALCKGKANGKNNPVATPVERTGRLDYDDGRRLVAEMRRHLPAHAIDLADELDRVLVKSWTEVDEALNMLQSAQRYLSRYRGESGTIDYKNL
jgi:hypothetical protein